MKTIFSKKDLVKFGQYLLSEKRKKSIEYNYNKEDNISLEERLQEVYDADIENFIGSIRKKD
jgi:hypothetical protein